MNRVLTVILVAIVSVGLVAYALSLTSPEETITPGNHQLEARPQEVPKESVPELTVGEHDPIAKIEAGDAVEVPELKLEEPSNIEAGDAVEAPELETYGGDVETELEKLPFKMSNGAEKILREKLAEEKSMIESRKEWIEDTKTEIVNFKELLDSVPEESKLHKQFSRELAVKESYLKSQRERLADNEKEVMLLEAALGGK